MKVVLVTGGFDPLHSGHIAYLTAAKKLGDKLVVGINSDEWLTRKKGKPFMPLRERISIISALTVVDDVLTWDDSDDSACGAIFKLMSTTSNCEYVFANGGDRTDLTTPEYKIYGDYPDVEFVFGVGGSDKINSSSWILDEWKTQKTERQWGYWRVLDDNPGAGYKVKELVIYPGKSLSNQKHFQRSEVWTILQGIVKIKTEWDERQEQVHLVPNTKPYEIDKGVWHHASNPGDSNAHVLEIQWGENCVEEDIVRRED